MHIFVACTLAISIGVASTGSSVYIIFGVFDFSRAVVRTTTNHRFVGPVSIDRGMTYGTNVGPGCDSRYS